MVVYLSGQGVPLEVYMKDTISLEVVDWASAVNAAILLMYHAREQEDVATALMSTILLYDLTEGVEQAPDVLRQPLQRWWNSPLAENDQHTMADMLPETRQLYDAWREVYEPWQRKELDKLRIA
jgi:hypothetical protein